MAYDDGMVVTDAGLLLQLKQLANVQALKISRVAYGDGEVPEGTDLKKITAMVSHKMDLPLVSQKVTENGTAEIQAYATNKEVAAPGFPIREIGVYAMDADTEILYSYANFGNHYDWMRSSKGSIPINDILKIEVVIGRTTNLEVILDTNLAFTTAAEFGDHLTSTNPHPEFLQLGGSVTNCTNVLVNRGNMHQLDQMPMDNFRTEVLGDSASTIPVLRSRVNQLETEQANIALKMIAENDCPNSNLLIAEDFKVPDMVDTAKVKITSIVAGDNGIDIQSDYDIITGSWYWVSDGINSEYIQLKSVIKNGSVYRVLAVDNIKNTYSIPATYMYRTTCVIANAVATGTGDKKGQSWGSSLVWKGAGANTVKNIDIETSQSKADTYDISGDTNFSAANEIILNMEG